MTDFPSLLTFSQTLQFDSEGGRGWRYARVSIINECPLLTFEGAGTCFQLHLTRADLANLHALIGEAINSGGETKETST